MNRLLILSGLPGSGKTTVADHFRLKGIKVLRMGELTEQILSDRNLPATETKENKIRRTLREKYGSDVYAQTLLPILKEESKKSRLIVVEGMRSKDELNVFQSLHIPITVIGIESAFPLRSNRLKIRKDRSLKQDELRKRDKWEKETGTLDVLKIADHTIVNNGTMKELIQKIKRIALP